MEPLDDKELGELLGKWEAPHAPASLSRAVLGDRKSRWPWFVSGTIRVPVPVAAALLLAGIWFFPRTPEVPSLPKPGPVAATPAPALEPSSSVAPQPLPIVTRPAKESASLAGFQPLKKVELRIIRELQ